MKQVFTSILLLAMAVSVNLSFAQNKKGTSRSKSVSGKSKAAPLTESVTEPWKQLNSTEKLVEITTDYGVMIAKLYDSTPLHRDNFIKLVQQHFYDSLLFHRIIDGFMIQGGDPTSKNASENVQLGGGSAPGGRIPAEFKPNLFHKKGALAAARDMNPEKASSNCQFYIVQGKPMSPQELNGNYSASQKEIYGRLGGTPFLDQGYTVFGEVISGLNVIDRIAKLPKQPGDRPTQNVMMKIRLLN